MRQAGTGASPSHYRPEDLVEGPIVVDEEDGGENEEPVEDSDDRPSSGADLSRFLKALRSGN